MKCPKGFIGNILICFRILTVLSIWKIIFFKSYLLTDKSTSFYPTTYSLFIIVSMMSRLTGS